MKSKREKTGILLITTLLILSLLTMMTVGFVTINRNNLQLASNLHSQEEALEAAYSGLHYVEMRFATDAKFGNDIGGGWALSGSVNATPGFTPYEGHNAVVGILAGGKSHFQVHFSSTVYNDDTIAANPTSPGSWGGGYTDNKRQSCNNFSKSGGCQAGALFIPPTDSTMIYSIGYANGVTRVVQALFQEVAYVNSSVQSAGDISVDIPTTCTSGSGDQNWHVTTVDPLYNNIRTGIKATGNPNQPFANAGGNITTPGGLDANGNPQHVTFSDVSGAGSSGAAYALINGSTGGMVKLGSGGPTKGGSAALPQTNIDVSSSNGTGFLEANSNNTGNLPTKEIQASDILNQVGAGFTTDANGLTIPTTNTAYIPAGIWSFKDDGGKGDILDVYDFSGGLIQEFKGDVTGPSGGPPIFTVKKYQIQVKPGVNLVVDKNYTSSGSPNKLGTVSSQVASGNMMVTLSPTDFPTTNVDSKGKSVLPTLALDYKATNALGPNPASLTIGGNLYVQGQLVGSGAVVVQNNDATPWNSTWKTSETFSTSWASTVATSSNQGEPTAVDTSGKVTGNIAVEGNSQLSAASNKSVALYADNAAAFNPIPAVPSNIVNPGDGQAFYSAMNNFAQGTNGTGGWWREKINPDVDESLNHFSQIDQDNYPALLRQAQNGSGPQGLDNGNTGKTAVNLFGSSVIPSPTPDVAVNTYLTSHLLSGTSNLDLYEYAQLEQYKASGDSTWLLYNPPPSGDPDPVESAILSQISNYAGAVQGSNYKNLGAYMYGVYGGGGGIGNTNPQNMTFQGLLYVKGSGTAFQVNSGCYQFTSQGALMTTNGSVSISNASQVNFIYDPTQVFNYISDPYAGANGGYETRIVWLTLW